MDNPVLDAEILLERFPGKGGWNYAAIPDLWQDKSKPFGWVKVTGFIDDYEIGETQLMPMGNKRLFLSVKAAIRKVINKEAGQTVHLKLYLAEKLQDYTQDFAICLQDEPAAWKHYQSFPVAEQKAYIDYIHAINNDATRIERMAESVSRIAEGKYARKL